VLADSWSASGSYIDTEGLWQACFFCTSVAAVGMVRSIPEHSWVLDIVHDYGCIMEKILFWLHVPSSA
jgi:hypothetical protein